MEHVEMIIELRTYETLYLVSSWGKAAEREPLSTSIVHLKSKGWRNNVATLESR